MNHANDNLTHGIFAHLNERHENIVVFFHSKTNYGLGRQSGLSISIFSSYLLNLLCRASNNLKKKKICSGKSLQKMVIYLITTCCGILLPYSPILLMVYSILLFHIVQGHSRQFICIHGFPFEFPLHIKSCMHARYCALIPVNTMKLN